jgi:peptidyl-tRNA hydrolase
MRAVDLNITYVYIIDDSLGMSKGKIAAQVSHVAMILADDNKVLGRAIVLKADRKQFNAIRMNLPVEFAMTADAGLNEVEMGTVTCIGFVQTEDTKKITKDLKLV